MGHLANSPLVEELRKLQYRQWFLDREDALAIVEILKKIKILLTVRYE